MNQNKEKNSKEINHMKALTKTHISSIRFRIKNHKLFFFHLDKVKMTNWLLLAKMRIKMRTGRE